MWGNMVALFTNGLISKFKKILRTVITYLSCIQMTNMQKNKHLFVKIAGMRILDATLY